MPLDGGSKKLNQRSKTVVKRTGLHVAVTTAIVLLVGATCGRAADAAEEPTSAAQCPATQLVLVNGTFDTSHQEDGNHDHGFGAMLAGPVIKAVNDGKTAQADFSVKADEKPSSPRSTSPTTSSTTTSLATRSSSPTSSSRQSSTSSTSQLASTTSTTSAPQSHEVASEVGRTYVVYPASAGGVTIPGLQFTGTTSYEDSMTAGVENTFKVLDKIAEQCPDTQVFLAGHSQGAQVASTVAREIGSGSASFPADKIAGVALFSDPTRSKGAPTIQGGNTTPSAVPGTSGTQVAQVGNFQSPDAAKLDGGGMGVDATGGKDFGALANRTASWCVPGDLVCDLPISGELSQLVVNTAQKLDLGDPQKSLQAITDTLSPAVTMGGAKDVKDISFGDKGLNVKQGDYADTSLIGRVANSTKAQHAAATTVPSTRASAQAGTAPTTRTQAAQAGTNPVAAGVGAGLERDLLAAVNKIGGMALNTGIAVAKKALTPANIIQVVAAGVVDPMAGLAVATKKLASAATEVLTPETAVGMAQQVFDETEILGISGDKLAQVAVEAAGHGAAHNAYNTAPVTKDGRTAIQASADWAVAATSDATGQNFAQPSTAGAQPAAHGTGAAVDFDVNQAMGLINQMVGASQ